MFRFLILFPNAPPFTFQQTKLFAVHSFILYSFHKYLLSVNYTLATVLCLGNPEVGNTERAQLHRTHSVVYKGFVLLFTGPTSPQMPGAEFSSTLKSSMKSLLTPTPTQLEELTIPTAPQTLPSNLI